MFSQTFSLDQLGWRAFYSQQLTLDDLQAAHPARVAGVHRGQLSTLSESGAADVVLRRSVRDDIATRAVAVGDWVLVERATPRVVRVLDPSTVIVRLAAGDGTRPQVIAANVDTLFVVTSCNQDFNPSRLERYLALAFEAGVEPVIVLTKTDLCASADEYIQQAEAVTARAVVAVNATLRSSVALLESWLGRGQTVAFAGSSGVGKSTLVNTLLGAEIQATASIREDDSRGRHTTTARQLIAMPGGAWLIDTPGMRELRIGIADAGVRAAFDDIEAIACSCRFRDCSHQGDDGCALTAAIAEGRLEPRRLTNYLKLQREAAHAARSLHERRERERRFGKLYKSVQEQRRRDGG